MKYVAADIQHILDHTQQKSGMIVELLELLPCASGSVFPAREGRAICSFLLFLARGPVMRTVESAW